MTAINAPRAFDFGRNWQDFAGMIDDQAVDAAKVGLLRLFSEQSLRGARFLDIGCGSGVHALAAALLGANVVAIDIDPISVATTQALFASHGIAAEVRQMSVFDCADLGKFDIVYSWGVLHHTGDMWRAIECAAEHVANDGRLALALYRKTKLCSLWAKEKRLYSRLPHWFRAPLRLGFGLALLMRLMIAQRALPGTILREYRTDRGMSFWHDVDDWLGGYPYQSASPTRITAVANRLGLWTAKCPTSSRPIGIFGAGCAEFVFTRVTSHS